MKQSDTSSFSTVSYLLIEDWLAALRGYCSEEQMATFLNITSVSTVQGNSIQRVTLDQIFRLYQVAAVETDDEMMGLWTRPIRARALQHLLTTVRQATTLTSALFRFSTFWNLLLDDYKCDICKESGWVTLELSPRGDYPIQRFGHMLILKLAHGLLSWLAGYELPVAAVQFAFDRPIFAEDYSVIFPTQVKLGTPHSSISFDVGKLGPSNGRSSTEANTFLERAPRDWLFTSLREHTTTLRVRDFLYRSDWEKTTLNDAAAALTITPRTLMRRLDAEGSSFRMIKDELRRDIAIRDLQIGKKSIEEISQDVGFSTAANFHRAFRNWTGTTPSSYRR